MAYPGFIRDILILIFQLSGWEILGRFYLVDFQQD